MAIYGATRCTFEDRKVDLGKIYEATRPKPAWDEARPASRAAWQRFQEKPPKRSEAAKGLGQRFSVRPRPLPWRGLFVSGPQGVIQHPVLIAGGGITSCLVAGSKHSAEPLFLPGNHEFLWDGNE